MIMNKRCLLVLLICLVAFNFSVVFAETGETSNDRIKVLLNDKELKFDVSPTIMNNSVMVPMRQIFEYLGAQVDWKASTKNVIGYRRYKNSSNIFIKLKIGEDVAYNNGRKMHLISPPTIIDGRTLVPVRFISESFGLEVNWDQETQTVILSYDGNFSEGKISLDYTEYKPRFFDHGVKIMIPDYWKKLEGNNIFGFKDEFEDIKMQVYDVDIDTDLPLKYIIEEYKSILVNDYNDNIIIENSEISNINNIEVGSIKTKLQKSETNIAEHHYFFLANDTIFRATFNFPVLDEYDTYYTDIVKNIVSTIEVSSKTFNTSDEHYLEFDGFFSNQVDLKSDIYANKIVENNFDFKGNLSGESNVTMLKAFVSKGNRVHEFEIPVVNNHFDSTIYTPFGLGKHNVSIKAILEDEVQKIMQFSVVNMDVTDITYTMPSRYVDIKDNDTSDTAKLLTSDQVQERDRAFAIFEFIIKNINLESVQNTSIRNSAKVLFDKSGSTRELTYLYTAMARSINIPCKIYIGIKDKTVHYWNQVYVNGRWVLVDVARGSGILQENELFRELDLTYFDKDKIQYIEEFDEIMELKE